MITDRETRNKIRKIVDNDEKILDSEELFGGFCLVRVENRAGVPYSIILDLMKEYEVHSAETKDEVGMLIHFVQTEAERKEYHISPDELVILDDLAREEIFNTLFDMTKGEEPVGSGCSKIALLALKSDEHKKLVVKSIEALKEQIMGGRK